MKAVRNTRRIEAVIPIVLLIATIIVNGSAIASHSISTQEAGEISVGVNMHGFHTLMKESKDTTTAFPKNYYENSFKTLSSAGINTIRYLFTWESYEKNPAPFIKELTEVALTADKYGLKVIYDNDIFSTSSWLEPNSGYGFPSSLFENNPEFPYAGGGSHENTTAKKWWTDWYNRTVTNVDGRDGWTLQADFLKKVVTTVDGHQSTLGYEILNEPPVFGVDQWNKIGRYNTFITNELRTLTQKKIFFDRQLPSDIGGVIDALPENMAKMAPQNKTNVIFKSALYDIPAECNYAQDRLNTVKKTAQLLGIPLWMGEFNMGIYKQRPIAYLNQTGVDLFVQKFKELKLWGWAFWIWSYIRSPSDVNTYNLVNFTKKSSSVQPTIYFEYFKNTISDSNTRKFDLSSNDDSSTNSTTSTSTNTADNTRHTICPTLVITKVNGLKTGMKFSSPTPLMLSSKTFAGEFSVEGVAYDAASNVTKVEVKADDGHFKLAVPRVPGDWYSWSIKVPVNYGNTNANSIHKLSAKATDYYGNRKSVSIYIKLM